MNDITVNGYTISAAWVIAYIVLVGALFVIYVVAYTNVISRAGYSRWWILIMLVPVVNLIMMLVFCFKEWPVTREVRELRAQLAASQRGYGGANPYGNQQSFGSNPYAGPPASGGGYPGPSGPGTSNLPQG